MLSTALLGGRSRGCSIINIYLFAFAAKLCRIMNDHLEEVVFLKVSFETNKDMVSHALVSLLNVFWYMNTSHLLALGCSSVQEHGRQSAAFLQVFSRR